MNLYERNFHVEICDINLKNELTNYGILRMMQEIGAAHSDDLGISVNHFKERPYTWLLLNWKLKVFFRPNWNSKLIVKTWPSAADKLYAYRDFEIFTENNKLVAQGTSKWVLMSLNTLSIVKNFQEFLTTFEPLNKGSIFNEPISKLKEPEQQELIGHHKISRSDLDTNCHANNLSYLKIASDFLPEDVYNMNFNDIEIMYKKECKFGDEVACFYSKINDTHTITIKSKDSSKLHCIIQMS